MIYSQNDSRWRNIALGSEGRTIGSHGCLITCLAGGLALFGKEETPLTLLRKMEAVGGIAPSGDFIWTKLSLAFPDVHFHWRGSTVLDDKMFARETVSSAMAKVNSFLEMGQLAVLNVDNVFHDKRADHFVLASMKIPGSVMIHNPDGGVEELFTARYGSLETGLYGYGLVIGPRLMPCEQPSKGLGIWKAKEIELANRRQDYARVDTYSRELVDTII